MAEELPVASIQQAVYGLPSGLAYFVPIVIGTPPYQSSDSRSTAAKVFKLILDTGSANTAVITSTCCADSSSTTYDCSTSPSCVSTSTTMSVTYITGSWSGKAVRDTVSGPGLKAIKDFPFCEILQESGFLQEGYDGIIGLGYPSIAAPSENPPDPYFELVRKSYGVRNIFSLLACGALQPLSEFPESTALDLHAGELLLGGVRALNGSAYHTGRIAYTPLIQEKWYNVIVLDIGVNEQSLNINCAEINNPRSIIDSGSSNIALPVSVYSKVVESLKTQARLQMNGKVNDAFFRDDWTCCSSACDSANPDSIIYKFPSLSFSLAVMDDSGLKQNSTVTVTIPPEYIWRPVLLSTGLGSEISCRVFGISEGAVMLLGNTFMDGLLTVHDRENQKVGLAIADNCPNKVKSTKKISNHFLKGSTARKKSICDCLSSFDRTSSLITTYWPFRSNMCFFWQWWMYVVIICSIVLFVCFGIFLYTHYRQKALLRQLKIIDEQRRQSTVPNSLEEQLLPGKSQVSASR